MAKRTGNITIAGDVNVWPHELETAKALARAGLTVEFIRRSEEQHAVSADVLIGGLVWEMKSPTSGKMRMVQQNLCRATRQSENVIFDSRRMKGLPDRAIEREVRKQSAELKHLKRLKCVNRHGDVIDIK